MPFAHRPGPPEPASAPLPAYNASMRPMMTLLLALLPAAALAQQPRIEREGTLDPRKNQKIEFIHIEDAGNRIDEVRVGGQTQSITVQPKAGNVPRYHVPGNDMGRRRPVDAREGSSDSRQRVWDVLSF